MPHEAPFFLFSNVVLLTFFVYFAQTCNVLTGAAYELFAPDVVFHYRNQRRLEEKQN